MQKSIEMSNNIIDHDPDENKEFAEKVATILDDDAREKQELDSQMDVYPEESIYIKFAPNHDLSLIHI